MWWCVGACRGRTDLKLFRTTNREDNNKALFSSSSYSFLFFLFDWIPPFFLFSYTQTHTDTKKTTKPKIPNYTNNQPCVCVCLFSFLISAHLSSGAIWWSFATLHGNAINPIPFHDEKHKTLKETKTTKKTFLFVSLPLASSSYRVLNIILIFKWKMVCLSYSYPPTEMKQMPPIIKSNQRWKLWKDTWCFISPTIISL